MQYILLVDPEKCDGCRRCEMICSLAKTGNEFNPMKARIRIMKKEAMGIDVPMVCRHCEDPPCRKVCSTNAIYRDRKTGATLINEHLCIGCRECMLVCPFGALAFDPIKRVIINCDLCQGKPKCVEVCLNDAIKYVRADRADLYKKVSAMEKEMDAIIKARGTLVAGATS